MVPRLIAQARRRLMKNALAVEIGRSGGACLAALVLALLVGTDIVIWRYLATLPIATFAIGLYLSWRGRFNDYQIAQLLDTRLGLCDTLSTAVFYYAPLAQCKCDEATRLSQRRWAEIALAEIDVDRALPVRFPRGLIAAIAGLALVAAGLTLLRFQMHDGAAFRHSVARMTEPLLKRAADEIAKLEKQLQPPAAKPAEQKRETGDQKAKGADSGATSTDLSDNLQPRSEAPQKNQSGKDGGNSKNDAARKTADNTGDIEQTPSESENAPRDEASSRDNGSRSSAGSQANSPQGDSQPSHQAASRNNASSSLWNKVSDTVARLTSLTSKAGNASKNPSGQNAQSAANRQRAAGAPLEPGAQQPENGGQPGMNGQSGGSDPHAPNKSGSGAGSEDGNKAIHEAEELEAMGKISVILGRRSQELTGTATVETVSGRSELATRYVARRSQHASVDDTAARDQIPLEFETYVQNYLAEQRRSRIVRRK
jgi:hypothetical protein